MNKPIHVETVNGYRVSIFPDTDAPNPLEDTDEIGIIMSTFRSSIFLDPATKDAREHPDMVDLSRTTNGDIWIPDDATLESAKLLSGQERADFMDSRARQANESFRLWLDGEVYGYVIEHISKCKCCEQEIVKHVDSCWGFYGYDVCLAEAKAEAKADRAV